MHSKYYGSRKLKQPIFGMEGVSILRKHFLKKTRPAGGDRLDGYTKKETVSAAGTGVSLSLDKISLEGPSGRFGLERAKRARGEGHNQRAFFKEARRQGDACPPVRGSSLWSKGIDK